MSQTEEMKKQKLLSQIHGEKCWPSVDKQAPCENACPLHMDVPSYVIAISRVSSMRRWKSSVRPILFHRFVVAYAIIPVKRNATARLWMTRSRSNG